MTTAKYELTEETIDHYGTKLHRIRALRDIDRFGVMRGDLGGYVESEENLAQEGDAWIGGSARVFGSARVYGSARVFDSARVSDSAQVSGTAQVSGSARVYGTARVYDSARVSGSAQVSGTAQVSGSALVSESRHVLTIGPIGSEDVTITLAKADNEAGHILNVGCWTGTVPELMAEVKSRRKSWHSLNEAESGIRKAEYKAAKTLCELRIASWGESA